LPPAVTTQITQHTLWQALIGDLPPLALAPNLIQRATLDSRTVEAGDLFIALPGQTTDGNLFVAQAFASGAQAVLCEARGRAQAAEAGAVILECAAASDTAARWRDAPANALTGKPLAYIVEDATLAMQKVGGFQRVHRSHPDLKVIGITGSVGKTSTKELTAAVVSRRYLTLHNIGNLNSEQGLPLTLMELGPAYERAVLEMAMYDIGEIATLCRLARPQIGVITNVGVSHLSRLGAIERIAQAKAELVRALPSAGDGGIAILNWDDDHVRAMAKLTNAKIFKYGLTPQADLWADDIHGEGMNGIRFRFHYRTPGQEEAETLYVRVPLLGRHSVHTALRAAAVGLADGLSWEEIIAGMQSIPGQLRLVVVSGINHSTVIDDTYNASPDSMIAALNLLHDLDPENNGRRVAVLGDMLELGDYTSEGHKMVGRRAADVADLLVTVGELGHAIGEEAQDAGFSTDSLYMMDDAAQTVRLLSEILAPGDLVLVKGSRAVGMDSIVAAIAQDNPARRFTQSQASEG
jgi:UDP-N-acetylmuramoyl-tripeptide--D-alanyl-D-alanine ligase